MDTLRLMRGNAVAAAMLAWAAYAAWCGFPLAGLALSVVAPNLSAWGRARWRWQFGPAFGTLLLIWGVAAWLVIAALLLGYEVSARR